MRNITKNEASVIASEIIDSISFDTSGVTERINHLVGEGFTCKIAQFKHVYLSQSDIKVLVIYTQDGTRSPMVDVSPGNRGIAVITISNWLYSQLTPSGTIGNSDDIAIIHEETDEEHRARISSLAIQSMDNLTVVNSIIAEICAIAVTYPIISVKNISNEIKLIFNKMFNSVKVNVAIVAIDNITAIRIIFEGILLPTVMLVDGEITTESKDILVTWLKNKLQN